MLWLTIWNEKKKSLHIKCRNCYPSHKTLWKGRRIQIWYMYVYMYSYTYSLSIRCSSQTFAQTTFPIVFLAVCFHGCAGNCTTWMASIHLVFGKSISLSFIVICANFFLKDKAVFCDQNSLQRLVQVYSEKKHFHSSVPMVLHPGDMSVLRRDNCFFCQYLIIALLLCIVPCHSLQRKIISASTFVSWEIGQVCGFSALINLLKKWCACNVLR